ncbi:MarR family winged helix-turn-helix transcriptional regulator [Furfurilactobacillus sp. WILCCON 0119]
MTEFTFADRPDDDRLKLTLAAYTTMTDPEAASLFLDFQWTFREMQAAYETVLARYELSESKFILLMFLDNEPSHALLPSELATKLGASRATVSKLLVGMERSGWITKDHVLADKRAVLIRLTDAGRTVLTAFLPENFRAVATIFSNFSAEERAQLTRLLNKVKQGTTQLNDKRGLENE